MVEEEEGKVALRVRGERRDGGRSGCRTQGVSVSIVDIVILSLRRAVRCSSNSNRGDVRRVVCGCSDSLVDLPILD